MKSQILLLAAILCLSITTPASAQYSLHAYGGLDANVGSHEFAPFYMSTNRHGTLTQSKGLLLHVGAEDSLSTDRRFDFSWGVEAWGGITSKADYRRWNISDGRFLYHGERPASIWLQQLYGEVKYHSLVLSVGMKSRGSAMLNQELSSGDLIWSGNAKGVPEVRLGFVDFQDIPFINGWVQADICLSYGKFVDRDWVENHYSYYRGKINPNPLWTYKRLYLRTKPSKPFSFQFGFQLSGFFGGTTYTYDKGVITEQTNNPENLKQFFKMLLPLSGNSEGNYVAGDHKGSWDGCARYRFRNGDELKGYFEWFWEDGSGLVKNNGWDGLWGLEYKSSKRWWIDGAVVEYLDFTHQSGPIHYDPSDATGIPIDNQVRGRDNYYDSWYYRAYANYGMTIGTPLVMGPVYNTDGSSSLLAPRVRAIHLAVEGSIGSDIDYTVKYSHRKAWGNPNTYTMVYPRHADSWMVAATYRPSKIKGLSLNLQLAFDHGTLPTNAAGVLLGITYDKIFNIK